MLKCIRLNNPNIDDDVVLQSLLTTSTRTKPVLFHFDISSSVSLKTIGEGLLKSVTAVVAKVLSLWMYFDANVAWFLFI